jgi:hypothetical protein
LVTVVTASFDKDTYNIGDTISCLFSWDGAYVCSTNPPQAVAYMYITNPSGTIVAGQWTSQEIGGNHTLSYITNSDSQIGTYKAQIGAINMPYGALNCPYQLIEDTCILQNLQPWCESNWLEVNYIQGETMMATFEWADAFSCGNYGYLSIIKPDGYNYGFTILNNISGTQQINFPTDTNTPTGTYIAHIFIYDSSECTNLEGYAYCTLLPYVKQCTCDTTPPAPIPGYVTVNPSGCTFPSQCECGTQVTVTAIPNPGYHFTGWVGDYNGTDNPYIFILNDNNGMFYATFAEGEIGACCDGEICTQKYSNECTGSFYLNTPCTPNPCIQIPKDCINPTGKNDEILNCGVAPLDKTHKWKCVDGVWTDQNVNPACSANICEGKTETECVSPCFWYQKYFWEEPSCHNTEQNIIMDYLPFMIMGAGAVIFIGAIFLTSKKSQGYISPAPSNKEE